MLPSSTLCLFRHGVFGLLTLAQALLSAGAPQTRHDFASLSVTSGLVRLGKARLGKARWGPVCRGWARQGREIEAWLGSVWCGVARSG